MRTSIAIALLIVSGSPFAGAPSAIPQRMPGLWLMNTEVSGIQHAIRDFHICVAEDSDDVLAHPNLSMPGCTPQNWRRDGHFTYYDAACPAGTGSVTLAGRFLGDFAYNFQGELTLTYAPPLDGVETVTVSYEGRRLGPCKAHLNPGTFLIQGQDGIGNLNLSQ